MDVNKRKLVVVDLGLAIVVIALFQLAPSTANSTTDNAGSNQISSDVGSGNDLGISTVLRSSDFFVSPLSQWKQ